MWSAYFKGSPNCSTPPHIFYVTSYNRNLSSQDALTCFLEPPEVTGLCPQAAVVDEHKWIIFTSVIVDVELA